MKLNPWALGLSLGIIDGLYMILIGLAGLFGLGGDFVTTLAEFYIGYSISYAGLAIGFLWGCVEGFIFGILIAGIYNFFCVNSKK